MTKSISKDTPEIFRRDKDGSTVFRWDIKQVVNDDGETQYEANEARIYVTPTLENVETGAIEAHCSLSSQAALLHDNNESMLAKGIPTIEYEAFLAERTKIKTAVKTYFDSVKVVAEPVIPEPIVKK